MNRIPHYFNPQTFNVLISEHSALMIFAVLVPVFAGLGNFVIPLMIGAGDMAFPRLNALSYRKCQDAVTRALVGMGARFASALIGVVGYRLFNFWLADRVGADRDSVPR